MPNAVTTNGSDDPPVAAAGGGARPPRLPRWTRQEILILIQGKKVAESRGRGRTGSRVQQMGRLSGESTGASMVGGSRLLEPKWASVSSYCRRHGVNRGPVQCRKRWSNLAGDFKKIKEWEVRRSSGGGGESFWAMRNDLRRERKLPGFFDREVFDIMDGAAAAATVTEVDERKEEGRQEGGGDGARPVAMVEEEETEASAEADAVLDSGRPAADDGLFSDSEQEHEEERPTTMGTAVLAITPISERKFDGSCPSSSGQGTCKEKQSGDNVETGTTSGERNKRQRTSPDEAEGETKLQDELIEVLKWNSRMLTEQLEVQNRNSQLDREQRKNQTNCMVQALGKLADAIGKIADKL